MQTNNIRAVILFFVLLFFILPASWIVYNRAYRLPSKAIKTDTYFTNVSVLQNTLPQSIIDTAEEQVARYAGDNQLTAGSFEVAGAPAVANGGYEFTLIPDRGGDNLDVILTLVNSNSVYSMNTTINGEAQPNLNSSTNQ